LGEARLIRLGLIVMAIGLLLIATTPRQPLPSYDRQALAQELSGERSLPGETPPTQTLQITLPPDTNKGYTGLIWILLSMIPMAIGGGVLQPSINSLLTRNASVGEIGGTLGISAALLSGANAFAPVIGGSIFQTFGANAPFLMGSIIMFLLFLVTTWKFHSRQGAESFA
jgi:MFS family permease